MPLKRPPVGTLIHRRRNGRFFLQIHGHAEYGLPFGQDRLVAIWAATQAVRQRSRIVRFEATLPRSRMPSRVWKQIRFQATRV
jgi:hypothetical protein